MKKYGQGRCCAEKLSEKKKKKSYLDELDTDWEEALGILN